MWVSRVRWVGRMVGGPVRVAGRELGVADVRGDQVALQRLNAVFSMVMWVAPVVFQVEKSLRLEDGVLKVRLDPLHASNALVTGERSLLGMASPHGRAHVPGTLVA